MKEFFSKEKLKDIYYILLLLILFTISAVLLGHAYGDLFMDCGREAYLPELMLKGKILFRDIFGMYNPLSYQINAFLYLIFGTSLKTLYGAAYFNAFLMLIGIYFISKLFISRFYSFVITLLIMSLYVFGCYSIHSYLFPYSFAFPYATTLLTFSVLFSLLYIKNENNKVLIYLSSLLLGFSFANKPDFAVCLIPVILLFFFKKESIKTVFTSVGLFLLPVVLSYLILIFQGFTLNDFINYMVFIRKFFHTEEQVFYTVNHLMQPWDLHNFKILFKDFINFTCFCVSGILLFHLFTKKIYFKILGFVLLPLYLMYGLRYAEITHHSMCFSWILLPLIIILYFTVKAQKTVEDKMLIFLIVTGFLSMWRINFLPVSKPSCAVYMILPIIALWIYFIRYTPEYLKNINYRLYLSVTFIILSVLNIVNIKTGNIKWLDKIQVKDSYTYTLKSFTYLFGNLEDWINNNTKAKESVLVMPEGVMLNFTTGRPTKPMYYHLIPNHISTLGETNVVEGLDADRPDYIIITNTNYDMYGHTKMCKDFGLKICDFVEKNYTLQEEIDTLHGNNSLLSAKIYKLKK